ncbi:penicillin-binding transpeptidase domain-containing protein [Rothia halotolerans]|uniref:penicillin-binding transpeptidase domain-containing protein n=1 Tax=Rothia halotolerans TaxID=405770 RepID=UPI00101BC136|nr:penicillin-binding transpeptidase domain-containing protein [Rothia halotolerans]
MITSRPPHRPRTRPIALSALAVLGVTAALSGCSPDDGRETAERLAQALSGRSLDGVDVAPSDAGGQDPSGRVADVLEQMPGDPEVSLAEYSAGDGGGTARLDWTWELSEDASWTYRTEATLEQGEDGWTLDYSPDLLAPGLRQDEVLGLSRASAERGRILDAHGVALMNDRPVHRVGVDKEGLSEEEAERSARALADVLDIDAGQYAQQVAGYGDEAFVEALALREDDYREVAQRIGDVDGAHVVDDTMPLARERGYATGVLGSVGEASAEDIEASDGELAAGDVLGRGGLQEAYQDELSGTDGYVVSAVPDGGPDGEGESTGQARPLETVEQQDGEDLTTTLDERYQTAAQKVLEDVESPSAAVVVRPSTGEVLAAADGPDSEGYGTSLLGQYAPGSVFKLATAAGLLEQGKDPDSPVQCTPDITVDGREFSNASTYLPDHTGEISLREAMAQSCNTAFIAEHEELSQAELADAARSLGFGQDLDLGIDAFGGSIGEEDSGAEHAASMIGQGRVLTSPLGMAVMAASIQNGSVVQPELVAGHEPEGEPAASSLSEEQFGQLREMMRSVVTDGHLTVLQDVPGEPVGGKTGTAEYGDETPPRTHSWVVAVQGDLAVSVFVEDGDYGAVTGGPVMEDLLTRLADLPEPESAGQG